MKIAFDHQAFTNQYGGVSRYYSILASELSLLKQDVSIFAGLHRNKHLQDVPAKLVRGIRLESYPRKTSKAFHLLNHASTEIQIKSWKPDVVHETYYSSLPTLGSNVIRVTTAYDMIHEIFRQDFPLRDQTTKHKLKTFERVDHIVSISHRTKKDLVEIFGIDDAKISVVHLGVDVGKYQNIISENSNRRPFLLYVGVRSGYKNFTSVVRAIASSSILRKEFDLIAFGGGAFSVDELQLFKDLGYSASQVKQMSGDDSVLAMLYDQAVTFIYPSLYEGFGLPPLEAMAAGCPIVCSNTSSIPEVVNDAGEYFDPDNLQEICKAIEKVAFSHEVRLELINRGFINVKKFSWEKCAQKTLSLYEKLVGSK